MLPHFILPPPSVEMTLAINYRGEIFLVASRDTQEEIKLNDAAQMQKKSRT